MPALTAMPAAAAASRICRAAYTALSKREGLALDQAQGATLGLVTRAIALFVVVGV